MTPTESAQTQASADAVAPLRALLDPTPVPVWVNHRGRIVYVNQAGLLVLGAVAPEQIVGRSPLDFVAPEHHALVRERMARLEAAEGPNPPLEQRWLRLDGTPVPVEVMAWTIPFGTDQAIQVTFTDLTARQREGAARRAAELKLRATKERLRFALETSEFVGVWDWDVGADRVVADARFAQLYGVDPARAAAGMPIAEFTRTVHPDDQARLEEIVQQVLAQGGAYACEYRLVQPDGSARWVLARGRCLLDAEGRPVRFPGAAVDITERKRLEEALRASEEQYRRLVEENPVGIVAGVVVGPRKGHLSLVNDAYLRLIGYTREELQAGAVDWLRLTPPEWLPADDAGIAACLRSGRSEPYEKEYVHRAGHRVPVMIAPAMIPGTDECFSFVLDLTERKRAEAERQAATERLELVQKATGLGVFDWDLVADTSVVSPEWRRIYGFPDSSPMPAHEDWRNAVHPHDRERATAKALAMAQSGGSYEDEFRVVWPDGTVHWVRSLGRTVFDAQGRAARFIGTALEVTEQREAEEALQKQLRLTEAITSNATTALFIMDEHQQCVYMNPAAEQLTGYTLAETRGRALHDVVHHTRPDGTPYPLEECPIDRVMPQNDQQQGEEVFVHRDGHFYQVSFTASPLRSEAGQVTGTVIEVVDITERKRQEAERREQQALLDAMLDALPVAMAIADQQGRMVRVNPAFGNVWGRSAPRTANAAGGYEGYRGYHLETGTPVAPHEWPLARTMATGAVINGERYGVEHLDDGRHLIVDISSAPVRGKDGDILGGVVASMDVTERVQAEQAVRASEEEFRTLANAIPQLCWMARADGHIFWYNQRWYEYTGTTPAQMAGWGWQDVHDPAELPRVLGEWTGAIARGEPVEMIFPLRGADGVFRTFLTRVQPVKDAQGQVLRWFGTNTDISGQKRIEAELREREERHRLVLQATNDAIWDWNLLTDTIEWNRSVRDRFGYDLTEVDPGGAWWKNHIHPADRQRVVEGIHAVIDGTTEHWVEEYRFERSDGSFAEVLDRGYVVRDAQGRAVRMIGSMLDLTPQKQAAAALRDSEARFRALAETVPEVLFSNTADGWCDYTSPGFADFTDLSPEETLGYGWIKALHPDDVEPTRERWQRCVQTGQPFDVEYRFRRYDGTYHWFVARATPLRDDSGQIVRWFGAATDIDAQKRTEQELRMANADLESFAFAAAHDLQEPLRMVASYTQLLGRTLKDRLTGDDRLFMDQVVGGAKRMSLLLADLLAYTETGRDTDAPLEEVDLDDPLEEALANLQRTIGEAGATVEYGPLPSVLGRRSHFMQLWQNLVGNALKYRGASAPVVSISAERQGGQWLVRVADNGEGIDPEYLDRIFGVFKRLHGKEIPGTGIGLAICQRVVERAGGRIWAESPGKGQGTTFCFTLPVLEDSNA